MLHVYDCRFENSTVPKKTLDASGLRLNDFLRVVYKVKKIVRSYFIIDLKWFKLSCAHVLINTFGPSSSD